MCKKCAGVTCACGECDPETGKCNPPDEECKCYGVTCKCGQCDEATGECNPRDEECKCTKGVDPYCCSDKTVCQCDEETGDVSTVETCEDYCANGECQEDKCKGVTCECGECDPATGECNPPDEECPCHGVTCNCGECNPETGECKPKNESCEPCEEEGGTWCRGNAVVETCVNGFWRMTAICLAPQTCRNGECQDLCAGVVCEKKCYECNPLNGKCEEDLECDRCEGVVCPPACLCNNYTGECVSKNGDAPDDCEDPTPDWDAEACKCVCKKKPCESGQVWDESACQCVDPCAECKKSCRFPKSCTYNLTQQTCACQGFCGDAPLGPCQKCGTDEWGRPIPVNLCNECQTCKNETCVNNNDYDECMCDGEGIWTGTTCCSTAKDGKDTNGVYTEACCKAANGSWSNATCCSTAKDGKDTNGVYTEACCKAANGTWEDNKCSFNQCKAGEVWDTSDEAKNYESATVPGVGSCCPKYSGIWTGTECCSKSSRDDNYWTKKTSVGCATAYCATRGHWDTSDEAKNDDRADLPGVGSCCVGNNWKYTACCVGQYNSWTGTPTATCGEESCKKVGDHWDTSWEAKNAKNVTNGTVPGEGSCCPIRRWKDTECCNSVNNYWTGQFSATCCQAKGGKVESYDGEPICIY